MISRFQNLSKDFLRFFTRFHISSALKAAKKAAIPARYVLFDSWFSSPSTLHAVKSIGYDVIDMVKKTPKMFFQYQGENMSLITIYNQNKKRRGRSRYLLSVPVDVVKDGEIIPAKVVYVRNRNKRKEYLCLISTDTTLDENEIIRIYSKRWDIEVFFKVCKSYLNLSRESNDNRSLGELFLYFSDEMSDITWIQAFQMLLQMFRSMLSDNTELSDNKIAELVDTFMSTLPASRYIGEIYVRSLRYLLKFLYMEFSQEIASLLVYSGLFPASPD